MRSPFKLSAKPTHQVAGPASTGHRTWPGRGWQRLAQGVCRCYPVFCQACHASCRTLFQYDPETLEIQTAAMAVGVGLWAGWTGQPPDNGASIYHLMTRLLPGHLWSALFITLGVTQTSAMVKNRIAWRAASAMLSFLVWSFLSVLIVLDWMPGPSTILFPVIALSEAWVYLRLQTHGNGTTPKAPLAEPCPPEATSEATSAAANSKENDSASAADSRQAVPQR